MNKGKRAARKSAPQTPKAKLDLQTSYLTLLPPMEEGFSAGYQPKAGIVSDTNQKPGQWLENVAKYMRTQGEDVGYSIPDVLAGEQQMRRLLRLPFEDAIRHQEMVGWRAVLALLLLWDGWARDDTWPALAFEDYLTSESLAGAMAFQRTVAAALTQERIQDGLKIFTLTKARDQKPDKRPLCLVSKTVILMPAANSGDLGDLLPATVGWYDRQRCRWLDPCPYLQESDRERLVMQLRLLQCLNEQPELGSLLYSPEAGLHGALERFIDDLLGFRNQWRDRLAAREEEAVRELYVRTLTVFGLCGGDGSMYLDGLSEQRKSLDVGVLGQNPLIQVLMGAYAQLPDTIDDLNQTQYWVDGVPFARASSAFLLEPTNAPGEAALLRRLQEEVALLSEYSPDWNALMAKRLDILLEQVKSRVGIHPVALKLLEEWRARHAAHPLRRDRSLKLYYPIQGHPQALGLLMKDLIDLSDMQGVLGVFSDCLLLVSTQEHPPFDNPELAQMCRVRGDLEAEEPRYAVPPISPWLAAWLTDQEERDDPYAPKLLVESLSFTRERDTGDIVASFAVRCRRQGEDALLTNTVTFTRTYAQGGNGLGSVMEAPARELPFVVSWPNVRLSPGLWKQYFVYAHRPELVDVWVLGDEGWIQGDLRQALDVNPQGQQRLRVWQTAVSPRYPAYVALRRGAMSLGALMNDSPRQQLKHDAPAVVGLDFGSIATTVMLRQGDRVQSATFPRCLHAALLHGLEGEEAFLVDELLPQWVLLPQGIAAGQKESTFYSVMDVFTDQREHWKNILRDGHIYYRESLEALLQKGENTLYYDMKWGEETFTLACLRLFLKQVMIQAALSARLCGAPSLSWRVSMPNALPLPRQEGYLEMLRGLSAEVAQETGMPLTPEIPPVLYATENQADGLYFKGRNEVNVRNGYINMDIGGGTTDISLWLAGAQRATLETSLLLGCRQMLFDSVSTRHLSEFSADFEQSEESLKAVVRELVQALTGSVGSTRGRQKSMFLLDDFFADCDQEIWRMMESARSQGHISYVESLLLLNIGFLFHLCGELLARAWQNPLSKDLLHERLEICIAGNGGQLLKAFDNETRAKLCRMALQGLPSGHPVQELALVQSRHPKREVAIGLLSDEQRMASTVQGEPGPTALREPSDPQVHHGVLGDFPVRFYNAFPQAADRLMPGVFEKGPGGGGIVLTNAARLELGTVVDNEFFEPNEDELVAYVRCFAAMKRLWQV
ncbi:MAG: hypothetical protein VB099_17715 [Candidatus Limiplasma sp.]|nr:hypothetical protein [Candidatus Limiplasma sp.]